MGVTHFPHGVTANEGSGINAQLPITNPARVVVNSDDFSKFYPDLVAADAADVRYGVSVNASPLILAAGDVLGGVIEMQSAALAASGALMFTNNRSFEFQMAQPIWFETRLNVDDLETAFAVGMSDDQAVPLAPNNGVYFEKADNSANVNFVCIHDGGAATISESVGDIVLDENTVLGFYWDGVDLHWARDGQELGSAPVDLGDLPLDMVDITLGYQNLDSLAHSMFVDYYWIVSEFRGS